MEERRDTRSRLHWSVGLSWALSIPLLIVSIILLALTLGWLPMKGTSSDPAVTVHCASGLTENDTLCDQTTDCLQGFVGPETDPPSCTYLARPTNTTCTTPCYGRGDGMCDAQGKCVGNLTTCIGTCINNNECTSLGPFNEDVKQYFDPVTLWVWSTWYEPQACYYGSCIYLLFDIETTSTIDALGITPPNNAHYNFTIGGARTRCKDYLNATFYAVYKECLEINRYPLASELIDYSLFSSNDFYANSTFPFQLGVCVMSFTCSLTMDAAPPPIGKRALEQEEEEQVPFRSQEQWGFRRDPSNEAEVPLGIKHPRAKNEFWAWMHRTVKEAVPVYMPEFLKAHDDMMKILQGKKLAQDIAS